MRTTKPIILILLAIAALSLTACGGDEDKKPVSAGAAEKRVKSAVANAIQIRSGRADITAKIAALGLPGGINVEGGGPFDTEARGGGAYDLDLTANVAGNAQKLGFTAVGGQSYLTVGNRAYATGDGKSASPVGSLDVGSLIGVVRDLDKYLINIRESGNRTVDGEALQLYSAEVDLAALSREGTLSKVKVPSIPGVPLDGNLEDTFQKVTVSVGVADDDVPRSISLDAELKAEAGDDDPGGVEATLDILDLNESQKIEKPDNIVEGQDASAAMGALFGAFAGF